MKRLVILCSFLFIGCTNKVEEKINYVGKNIIEYSEYAAKNDINYSVEWKDSSEVYGTIISLGDTVVLSNSSLLFKEKKVDELGRVPIMMYHGIVNEVPTFIGGNIDKMGYNRSLEAFKKDLDFYYNNDYRTIRLIDYVNGIIDVELGKSPLVLTFDDGNSNNFKVLGIEDGKLLIDPNCAIGIMEEFKKNHPDFNMTATFFLHSGLFFQNKYSSEMLNWLVDNGYDIGNHTYTHIDLTSLTEEEVLENINKMYDLLKSKVGDKYVNILSLPFGKPYTKDHANFDEILKTSISTLRVGWETNPSPYSSSFDKTFIKRIRAYDNNGLENDIEYEFKRLEKNRFISDGNKDIVTIKESDRDILITDKTVIEYKE